MLVFTSYNNMLSTKIEESKLPRYLMGHASVIEKHSISFESDLFMEIGYMKYLGDYSVDKSGSIPVYEKKRE